MRPITGTARHRHRLAALVVLLMAASLPGEALAAGVSSQTAVTFLAIGLLLVAAKAAGLVERIGQPAVLGELLLRGPQTPGELRSRTHRMYAFPDLQEVEAALSILQEGEHRLVVKLPRAPGSREARFAQTLGGAEDPRATRPVEGAPEPPSALEDLRAEVAALRSDLEALRARVDGLERPPS